MKYEDVIWMIQTGLSAATLATATGNPLLAAGLDAANRMVKIGLDAFKSGRDRGEWSEAQIKHFDETVLPATTAQPHWIKTPEPLPT